MRNIPRGVRYAIAAAGVAIVVACGNGEHLSDQREQSEEIADNQDIEYLEGFADNLAKKNVTDSSTVEQRGIHERRLDELFTSCSATYEDASPNQRNQIKEALSKLFKDNPFANDYAYRSHPQGICGARPTPSSVQR